MSNAVNELHPELLSTNSINPFIRWMSASRIQMFGSHITQNLWVGGCNDQGIFSGMEQEFGKYTHAVKVPEDAHVIKTIVRYPRTLGANQIKHSPEKIIIFETEKVSASGKPYMELDYISQSTHHKLHQSFGYRFRKEADVEEYMAKDTVLASSPSIDPETKNWQYGIETNATLMTIPQIIEDGYVVSESFCEKSTTLCMEEIEINFGSNNFPINLHGDAENYKIMPDIGDVVSPTGLFMALRTYNESEAPVTMSVDSLRKPNYRYDDCIYVKPNSRVVDIKIYHDCRLDGHVRGKSPNTPVGTTDQCNKYHNAQYAFYDNIRKTYEELSRSRHGNVHISPKLDNLIYMAYINTVGVNNNNQGLRADYSKAVRSWRGVAIDEWRVVVTLEYEFKASIGSKITGRHGNKGVIVDIWPDEHMPISKKGVRADLIGDPIAIIKRMIPSVPLEMAINGSTTTVASTLVDMRKANVSLDVQREFLLKYYKITSPGQYEIFKDASDDILEEHIAKGLEQFLGGHPTGLSVWLPTNANVDSVDVCKTLTSNKDYAPEYDTVTYMGMSGEYVETINPQMIASMYIMTLEKTGRTWAGVSSAKLSHFGIPAKMTNSTKHLTPGRTQPIRFGESEFRLFAATVGARATAEMVDRTNNPTVRKEIQKTILRSPKPTAEYSLIDRKRYPTGNSRFNVMLQHYNLCAGRAFKRTNKRTEIKD